MLTTSSKPRDSLQTQLRNQNLPAPHLPFAFAFATNGIHYGYHVAAKAKAKVEQRARGLVGLFSKPLEERATRGSMAFLLLLFQRTESSVPATKPPLCKAIEGEIFSPTSKPIGKRVERAKTGKERNDRATEQRATDKAKKGNKRARTD